MPKIDTNELEALKVKAREVEVEVEKVEVEKWRLIFRFLTSMKWLIIGGGTAFILSKIGALPSSFSELVDALKSVIPSVK